MGMHLIETHGPVEIYLDPDPQNPRDWDNLGTLAIRQMGDEEPTTPPPNSIWLPVYRYEHSCTLFNTTGFHCPWDSGQTGYIYVTKQQVREEYGVQRISPNLRSRIEHVLKSEVETFSKWANGEVYGFINTETDDSCWGFYSIEEALDEAR